MTQNQIRSGGTPRAEKPPPLDETPVEEAGDETPVEEAGQELPAGEAGGEELSGDEELSEDEELEEAERPKLPLSERLKRTPPALAILTIAAIGSWGFLVLQLVSRTAPISVLTSSAVVTGLVYVAVTIVCGIATYRAASEGRTRLAFLLAFIGGTAAIVAAVSFAGALVLFLALGF